VQTAISPRSWRENYWFPLSVVVLTVGAYVGKKFVYPFVSTRWMSESSRMPEEESRKERGSLPPVSSSIGSTSTTSSSSASVVSSASTSAVSSTVAGATPVVEEKKQEEESFWTTKKAVTLTAIAMTVLFCGAKAQWEYSLWNSCTVSCIPLISHLAGAVENNMEKIQRLVNKYFLGWRVLVGGAVTVLFAVDKSSFFTMATAGILGYVAYKGASGFFRTAPQEEERREPVEESALMENPPEVKPSCCRRFCTTMTKTILWTAFSGLALVGAWTLWGKYGQGAQRFSNFPH
jgi:hypothetical protein